MNCPIPILAVSPSPETARKFKSLFAILAPVVTDGILPWAVLNPWLCLKKYAGVLLEHPIPDILAIPSGVIEFSHAAFIITLDMASWPQPGQR